jgi:hypothetical protein
LRYGSVMAMTPAEYIAKAANLIEEAGRATSPAKMRELTELATKCLELAEAADRKPFPRRVTNDAQTTPQPQQSQQTKLESDDE